MRADILHEVSTRRYATTPRINFHGGLRINQNTELTKYGKPKSEQSFKSKVKYLINLFK